LALRVVVCVIVSGVAYAIEEAVGSDPFVVYRIEHPGVAQLIATSVVVVNVPASGLITGAGSVPKFISYVAEDTSLSVEELLYPRALRVVVVFTEIGAL
jgi:hypothetical protein